jgi:S-adenosylmethionine synthetase
MRTAEFISPKHPDKLCDIISDTLLDKYLEKDPYTQCNIQTSGGFGKISIIGEVASDYHLSTEQIKEIVHQISGVEDVDIRLVEKNIKNNIITKSGVSIGYATTENKFNLPFEYYHARELNKFIYNSFPFEGKTQITINGDSASVLTSFQNTTSADLDKLVREYFSNTEFSVDRIDCNPLREWYSGGFFRGFGCSGKQNVIDNYGPRIPLGGGSYSGKDATHADRCGGYMARRIAVDSLKHYGLKYAVVELSYVSGTSQPIQARIKGNDKGIHIETGIKLYEVNGYDLTPNGIIDFLDLRKPIYAETSKWGHMGNNFNWR